MATLAFLVPLALLQLTTCYASQDLDIVITDEIRDAIRYFNRKSPKTHVVPLPDIKKKDNKAKTGIFDFEATKGKMSVKGVKLDANLATVKFVVTTPKKRKEHVHILTATFPLTIKDLELQYDKVNVDLQVNISSGMAQIKHPKPTHGAAKAKVTKNKFLVSAQVAHVYKDGKDISCYQTVDKIKVEEFEIKRIKITGLSPMTTEVVEALANAFKAELVRDTNAKVLLERLIKDTSLTFFPFYCTSVDHKEFNEFSE